MMKKKLGTTGLEVSAVGLGCWPIGGTWFDGENPICYEGIDDKESVKAIQAAIENGINFFDTSNVYGCGHSERILGQGIKGKRDKVVISTKFGNMIDEENKKPLGMDNSPEAIRKSCDDSLRRLGIDVIDLFLFHDYGYPADQAEPVRETLEELVDKGKIRSYGWSTDIIPSIKAFNKTEHNSAAQIGFNIFDGNRELLKYCEENNLVAMARSPLAMGLLSGKYDRNTVIKGNDIRTTSIEWVPFFQNGKASEDHLDKLDKVREILQSGGRTLVQGALAWLLGKSDHLVPIPGFRNTKQAVENAKVMELGPLSKDQVQEVENILQS